MTTVITPQLRHREDGDPVGRLAGTMLSVTVAGMADTQRFRRGKAYVTNGSVTRLEIRKGTLIGSVLGSRAEPYTSTISVDIMPRPSGLMTTPERDHVKSLIPHAGELVSTCTCPDWEDPCKHVVATLLALANEIAISPMLLVEWRCDIASSAQRATIGSRASGVRHLHSVPTADRPVNPFDSDAWRAFDGIGLPAVDLTAITQSIAARPLHLGPLVADSIDIAAVLRSAQASIRSHHEP